MSTNNIQKGDIVAAPKEASKVIDDRALQALQAEIEHHRKHLANATYVQKVLSFLPTGEATSLEKLEKMQKDELAKRVSHTREQIIEAVKEDQGALYWDDIGINSVSSMAKWGLTITGTRWSRLGSVALFALDSMHPNDSFGKQFVDGIFGSLIGSAAGRVARDTNASTNKMVSYFVSPFVISAGGTIGRNSWFKGSEVAPDPEAILNKPLLVKPHTEQTVVPERPRAPNAERPVFPQATKPVEYPNADYWYQLTHKQVSSKM